MANTFNLGQLKWRSRRSILELDIYFDNFIQNGYLDRLDQSQLEVYKQLLTMDDGDILLMLQGVLPVTDIKLKQLIDKIKLLK
jgi:antitoxin CptB